MLKMNKMIGKNIEINFLKTQMSSSPWEWSKFEKLNVVNSVNLVEDHVNKNFELIITLNRLGIFQQLWVTKKQNKIDLPKNYLTHNLLRVCRVGSSCVRLFVAPWTVACQAPLSIGFSRQEYCSGLPFPPSGDLPDPGIEPMSLMSPASAGGFTLFPLRYLKIL